MRTRLFAFLFALSLPTVAAAQTACPPGQVVTDDTGGNCCWPGQAWSRARSLCVGIPQCPPGLTAQGESCAGGAVAPVTPAPPIASAAPWEGTLPPPPPGPEGYVPAPGPPSQGMPQGYPAPAAPVMQGVPVRFAPAIADDEFTVTVTSSAGEQHCRAPCTLGLPPGPARVSVRGARSYQSELFVPPQPTVVRIRRFRAGRLVWGLVGIGVGVPFALAGLVLSTNSSRCDSYYSSGSCDSGTVGLTLMLLGSGLAVIAATTGFTTMGSNRLDVRPDYGQLARREGPRLAGFGLASVPGGALGGATFTF